MQKHLEGRKPRGASRAPRNANLPPRARQVPSTLWETQGRATLGRDAGEGAGKELGARMTGHRAWD